MNSNTDHDKKWNTILLLLGILLLIMEISKQLYLYFVYFHGHYDVWYVPFQLCSTPMYLCIIRYAVIHFHPNSHKAIDTFLQDFALLGGIAALLVPDGFTYPEHPFLTFHGYLWHILLILISLIIWKNHFAAPNIKGFFRSLYVFLPSVAIAEMINILLYPYGDCDMFYISPFHLSSQPVFHSIDLYLGRIPGIFIYILAMLAGGLLIHVIYTLLSRKFNH